MRKRTKFKQFMAYLLVLLMVIGVVPEGAFALNGTTTTSHWKPPTTGYVARRSSMRLIGTGYGSFFREYRTNSSNGINTYFDVTGYTTIRSGNLGGAGDVATTGTFTKGETGCLYDTAASASDVVTGIPGIITLGNDFLIDYFNNVGGYNFSEKDRLFIRENPLDNGLYAFDNKNHYVTSASNSDDEKDEDAAVAYPHYFYEDVNGTTTAAGKDIYTYILSNTYYANQWLVGTQGTQKDLKFRKGSDYTYQLGDEWYSKYIQGSKAETTEEYDRSVVNFIRDSRTILTIERQINLPVAFVNGGFESPTSDGITNANKNKENAHIYVDFIHPHVFRTTCKTCTSLYLEDCHYNVDELFKKLTSSPKGEYVLDKHDGCTQTHADYVCIKSDSGSFTVQDSFKMQSNTAGIGNYYATWKDNDSSAATLKNDKTTNYLKGYADFSDITYKPGDYENEKLTFTTGGTTHTASYKRADADAKGVSEKAITSFGTKGESSGNSLRYACIEYEETLDPVTVELEVWVQGQDPNVWKENKDKTANFEASCGHTASSGQEHWGECYKSTKTVTYDDFKEMRDKKDTLSMTSAKLTSLKLPEGLTNSDIKIVASDNPGYIYNKNLSGDVSAYFVYTDDNNKNVKQIKVTNIHLEDFKDTKIVINIDWDSIPGTMVVNYCNLSTEEVMDSVEKTHQYYDSDNTKIDIPYTIEKDGKTYTYTTEKSPNLTRQGTSTGEDQPQTDVATGYKDTDKFKVAFKGATAKTEGFLRATSTTKDGKVILNVYYKENEAEIPNIRIHYMIEGTKTEIKTAALTQKKADNTLGVPYTITESGNTYRYSSKDNGTVKDSSTIAWTLPTVSSQNGSLTVKTTGKGKGTEDVYVYYKKVKVNNYRIHYTFNGKDVKVTDWAMIASNLAEEGKRLSVSISSPSDSYTIDTNGSAYDVHNSKKASANKFTSTTYKTGEVIEDGYDYEIYIPLKEKPTEKQITVHYTYGGEVVRLSDGKLAEFVECKVTSSMVGTLYTLKSDLNAKVPAELTEAGYEVNYDLANAAYDTHTSNIARSYGILNKTNKSYRIKDAIVLESYDVYIPLKLTTDLTYDNIEIYYEFVGYNPNSDTFFRFAEDKARPAKTVVNKDSLPETYSLPSVPDVISDKGYVIPVWDKIKAISVSTDSMRNSLYSAGIDETYFTSYPINGDSYQVAVKDGSVSAIKVFIPVQTMMTTGQIVIHYYVDYGYYASEAEYYNGGVDKKTSQELYTQTITPVNGTNTIQLTPPKKMENGSITEYWEPCLATPGVIFDDV